MSEVIAPTKKRKRSKKFENLVGPTDPKVDNQARERLVGARIGLLLRHSFFGNLATRMKLVNADEWCSTAATDGLKFYYNSRFIMMLKPKEVEEDMLSKVKRTFVDYLERLEDSNKIDSHLVRKAKDELDIANDPDPENEEIEEDPTQQDLDIVPAQAPVQEPVMAEAPVKTYPMEDGSMLECYGDEERGFEIRQGERKLPTRFRNVNDADMAVKIFQKRNRKPDGNQDYLEER